MRSGWLGMESRGNFTNMFRNQKCQLSWTGSRPFQAEVVDVKRSRHVNFATFQHTTSTIDGPRAVLRIEKPSSLRLLFLRPEKGLGIDVSKPTRGAVPQENSCTSYFCSMRCPPFAMHENLSVPSRCAKTKLLPAPWMRNTILSQIYRITPPTKQNPPCRAAYGYGVAVSATADRISR